MYTYHKIDFSLKLNIMEQFFYKDESLCSMGGLWHYLTLYPLLSGFLESKSHLEWIELSVLGSHIQTQSTYIPQLQNNTSNFLI